MEMMLAIFILYLAGMIGIGVYTYLKSRDQDLEGYLLGGRSFGPWMTAFSAVHTGASGWVFTGWVAAGWIMGISALWYALTLPLFALLSFRFLAPRLRVESKENDSLTLEDFIARKLGDPFHLIKIVGTLIVVVLFMGYLGSQVVAAGIALQAAFKMDYSLAVFLTVLVIGVYVYLGGLRAAALTDVVQGIIVVFGFTVTPIVMIWSLGGWGSFVNAVGSIDPKLLSWDGGRAGAPLLMFVLGYFAIASSYFGFPGIVHKFMAAKDTKSLGPAMVIAVVAECGRMTGPVFIGMGARVILGQVQNPEQAYALYITQYFHPIVAGIMLSAILAAIMSSADSYCILITSAITNNIYRRILNPAVRQETAVTIGRVVVVVTSLVALAVGLYKIQSILYFAMFAFGALGMSFAAPLLFTIYWKRTTSWGALAGMLTGCLGSVAWLLWSPFYPDVREAFFAFPLALLSIVVVSLLTAKKPAEAVAKVSST